MVSMATYTSMIFCSVVSEPSEEVNIYFESRMFFLEMEENDLLLDIVEYLRELTRLSKKFQYCCVFTDCSKRREKSRKKAESEQKNLDMIPGLCDNTGRFGVEIPADGH